MKKVAAFLFFAVFLLSAQAAFAVPLTGQYTINVTTTQVDSDSWIFRYAVTNNNQYTVTYTGLDGFYLQIPDTAVISGVVTPASYAPGGAWYHYFSDDPNLLSALGVSAAEAGLQTQERWLGWWGGGVQSVYPIGTTVVFGFQADGVSLGMTGASPVTFWMFNPVQPAFRVSNGTSYTAYSTEVLGPVGVVPEPASLSLLGAGLLGLLFRRRV